jgi:hypothetical protein
MTRPTRLRARPSSTTLVGIFTLLAALVSALALAPRAEAFVYWANGAFCSKPAIGRANLDGTGVDKRFIRRIGIPVSVAVDARHIYWIASNGVIGRANLDGTGVDHSFITATAGPGDIAVDAHHVYWTAPKAIGRANLDGTGVDPDFITIPPPPGDPFGGTPKSIAVDAAHIYWTPSPGFPNVILAIGRANIDGTGVDPDFIPRGPPGSGVLGDIAVDASHIYWTEGGGVARANLDGSQIDATFIDVGASSLAVDGAHFYLATGSPSPTAVPRAGCDPPGVIGRASLTGTVDAGFRINTVFIPLGIAVNFSVGKLRKANNKGIAELTLEVPAPGEIALAQTTKLKGAEVRAKAAGEVRLAIKPRGKAKKKLAQHGKVKVGVEVTYTPDGGEPEAQVATLRLKR